MRSKGLFWTHVFFFFLSSKAPLNTHADTRDLTSLWPWGKSAEGEEPRCRYSMKTFYLFYLFWSHFYFWKLEASLRYSWRVTWQVCIKLWAWVHEYVSWLNYRGWSCQLLDEGLDGWTYSDKRWTDQLPPWQELKPRTNTLLICIKSVSEKKMRVHFRGLRKQSIHVWSPKKLILLKKKKISKMWFSDVRMWHFEISAETSCFKQKFAKICRVGTETFLCRNNNNWHKRPLVLEVKT